MPGLNILCVNPLDHAEAIKELFRAHERPEFPEYFDRAYPSAVQKGAKSWIGLDANDQVVMHIARFSRRFALGERTVTGGLLVNLMVAKLYRTFLPALTLLRYQVRDSKANGEVDFLYGDPTPRAERILRAAGLSRTGTLERFVLPLSGRTWYEDVAVRSYLVLTRVRTRRHRLAGRAHAAQGFNANELERPVGQASVLRPFRPPTLYRERLPAYPGPTDYWFSFHENSRSAQPSAAVLVRGHPDRTAQWVSLTRDPSVPVSALVPPLAARLRKDGYHQLWMCTLSEAQFAREMQAAGFFLRHKDSPSWRVR